MPNVRVSYEAARGCGYRKPGGLYLVSGALTEPCGKLPIPLHVCPTCGGGVKATRSYQWIMPRLLFSGVECRGPKTAFGPEGKMAYAINKALDKCAGCIVGGCMPERGGLLWIGGAYYKTADDFIREATVQGVSRRISALPKGFEPGKTVVYLAHRQVSFGARPCAEHVQAWSHPGKPECLECKNVKPAVFSAFVPRAVEYVVKGDETTEELERFEKRGIELVDVKRQQSEFEFGDGERRCPKGHTLEDHERMGWTCDEHVEREESDDE